MKKINVKLLVPIAAGIVAAAMAAAVIIGVGRARAELTEWSDVYNARMAQDDIGITLIENDVPVASRNYNTADQDGSWSGTASGELLGGMPKEGEGRVVLNQPYQEELKLANSGTINEYVRVTITRYWLDDEGNRTTSLKPDLIELNFVNVGSSWIEDTAAETDERSVFYYSSLLRSGAETDLITDTVTINNEVAKYVTQTRTGNKIVTTYDYDGYQFCLEATADAVQEHNAQDAATSAWGRPVTIDEAAGTLTLN